MSKFNVGDKVKYIGDLYKYYSINYPDNNMIGEIIETSCEMSKVQWYKSIGIWYNNKDLRIVEKNKEKDMTNEEIWEMLRPKMEKNNLKSTVSITYVPTLWDGKDLIESKKAYYEDDVHNAIAIAYRSGYERAMKGRPFKFGEKKKKGGHWEPIDIEQVIKGGYKVVEDCLGWQYKHLGTYKKGEDGKFYQWVEDDE